MERPWLLLLISSVLAASGQILFKLGATGATQLVSFLNGRVIFGLIAYGLGTVLWILALSRIPLNIAYGFTALTFCLVYLLSAFILHEPVSLRSWLGLGLVMAGFFVIALDR